MIGIEAMPQPKHVGEGTLGQQDWDLSSQVQEEDPGAPTLPMSRAEYRTEMRR